MAYLALGFPKKYRSIEDVSPITSLKLDASEKYLLAAQGRSLVVWNGQRKRVILYATELCEEGELLAADWSADGTKVFAATTDGTAYVLRVHQASIGNPWKTEQATTEQAEPDYQDYLWNLWSGNPTTPEKSFLELETKISVAKSGDEVRVLSFCTCPTGFVLGTSAGEIIRLSTAGEVRWRVHIPELLRCDHVLEKMGVTVSDAEPPTEAIAEILEQKGDDTAGGVVMMDYSKELEMCALVLGNGVAFLLSFPDGGEKGPDPHLSRWLGSSDVVAATLEHRRAIATIGLRNGNVELLNIGYTPGDRCTLMRTLTLSSWHFTSVETGPVSALNWSKDGTALAIAWKERGVAVWSVSGCRMVWTLRQVGNMGPADAGPRKNQWNSFALHVQSLTLEWGPGGYFLWSSEDGSSRENFQSCLAEIVLYRSGVLSNAYQSEATRTAFLGYDRVLILRSDLDAGKENLNWEQLLIPAEYIVHNWPPEFVAVNDDKSFVAVAGTRGVAVCATATRRWRLYGDLSPDGKMRCCALAWFGKVLLIFNEVTEDDGQKKYELNLLSRSNTLTQASQLQVDIPAKPLLVDVRADGFLLVVCSDALLYLYKLNEDTKAKRLTCTLRAKMILPTRESYSSLDRARTPGGGISVARIFPPLGFPELENYEKVSIPTKVMLGRSTGSLILIDMAKMMSIPLLRGVEQFWYSDPEPPEDSPFRDTETRPVFWAHGDEGVQVCFAADFQRLLDEHVQHPRIRSGEGSMEKWFDADPEVYPLGISSARGTMLGVTQCVEMEVLGGLDVLVPFYSIAVKSQPVLHRLLIHLMRSSYDDKFVLQFAVGCSHLPQFTDSLEWLLFEAVSEPYENLNGNGNDESMAPTASPLLPRVIRLLHYFGEYEDIVVTCARKLESKRWPRLFAEVGEPAALLDLCYMSSRFSTAAYLLVILQEMWGYVSALQHVHRLLEKSLETGCFQLAADLRHYLENAVDDTGSEPTPLMESQGLASPGTAKRTLRDADKVYLGDAAKDTQKQAMVVAAVLYRARQLLEAQEFRQLACLAIYMDFPLNLLLAREHEQGAYDAKRTFVRLHRSFGRIEPTTEMVQRVIDERSKQVSNGSESRKQFDSKASAKQAREHGAGSKLYLQALQDNYTPELTRRLRERSLQITSSELEYLERAAMDAGADDIAVVCSLLLLDLAALEPLLRRNTEMAAAFIGFLATSAGPGYELLAGYLRTLLSGDNHGSGAEGDR